MESVQRTFLLLRPGAPQFNPPSRAMLKLQTARDGLQVRLTVSALPPGALALYLFLQDGAPLYAGDIAGSSLYRILPGVRLQNIWGAAVIHTGTLVFCLKSTGVSWDGVQARFKLIHASRPTDTSSASVSYTEVAPPAALEPIHSSQPFEAPPALASHADAVLESALGHTPFEQPDALHSPAQPSELPNRMPEIIETEELIDS